MTSAIHKVLDSPKLSHALQFILIYVIFLAGFVFPTYIGPSRLENFFVPLLILSLLLIRPNFNKLFLGLIIIFFISSLVSVLLNLQYAYGLSNSLRWLKFALIYIFFSSIGFNQLQQIIKAILICFYLMILINLIQLINPLGLGSILAKWYTHHAQYYELGDTINRTFRLVGTEINPNNNGVLWLIMLTFFMSRFLFQKSLLNVVFICICLLFIILTQSRTTLVAAMLSTVIFLFVKGINLKTIVLFLLVVVAGTILVFALNFTYIMQLFLYNPLDLHSLQLRFSVWREMWEFFSKKPLFGWGFMEGIKHYLNSPPDNEHIYILLLNGGVGLFIFLLILIYSIFFYFPYSDKTRFAVTISLLAISFFILGVTNVTLTNIRVGLIFFAFCGIGNSLINQYNKSG